jgi:hypothetical protein
MYPAKAHFPKIVAVLTLGGPSRMTRSVLLAASLSVVLLGVVPGLGVPDAAAQTATAVRPNVRGRQYRLKVDSSPQQAAVYWSADNTPPRSYGIAGYTPLTIKVPKGQLKIVVELSGFKPSEQVIEVRKSQSYSVTLERAPRMARLDLQSSGEGAGAEVVIDGASRGTIPNSFELPAGRHQVEVKKQGYKPFSDWFDLAEGERRTRDISLERAEAPAGTLLVTSDAGGDVYVDGQRRDAAPAIITGVAAGDHVVEVRKEGLAPWRQTVTVPPGAQAKVAAVFGAAAAGNGSIRIISNEPDVQVFVDGEDKGKAPITINSAKPGEHIVGARKPRFKPVEQTVRVAAGENAIVSLRMEVAPPDRPHAALKVQSTVPNAEVFVDGSSLGRAPIDRNDLDPGKHYIVVHKDGFTDFKREIVLVENQPVTLVADLSATGSVRILSTPEGADVRIDGELIGKTPVARDGVGAGDHVIELKLKAYFDHKETVKIEGGREKLFSVDMQVLPTGPSPEQVQKRKTGMSSFGAKVNPVGGVTADFGLGYPYYFTARLTVGAFNVKPLGMDLGIEFQTFFDIYDLNLHARLQLLEAGPLAVAVRGDVGGGTGTNGRSTYFVDAGAVASLAFSDIATFSGTARFSAWSDSFCPTTTQEMNGVTPEAFCHDSTAWPALFGGKDPTMNRFSGSRLYFGFEAVAAIDRFTSVFLKIEFLPFPDQLSFKPRLAFEDAYDSALAKTDPFVYGMAGFSFKF